MDKRNISTVKDVHPTKALLDYCQTDCFAQNCHQLLVTKQHRKLTRWFLTSYPGSNWA